MSFHEGRKTPVTTVHGRSRTMNNVIEIFPLFLEMIHRNFVIASGWMESVRQSWLFSEHPPPSPLPVLVVLIYMLDPIIVPWVTRWRQYVKQFVPRGLNGLLWMDGRCGWRRGEDFTRGSSLIRELGIVPALLQRMRDTMAPSANRLFSASQCPQLGPDIGVTTVFVDLKIIVLVSPE